MHEQKRKREDGDPDAPRSMVFKIGKNIGKSLQELVLDFRKVMEPNTASKLQERPSNSVKDFSAMAGPLKVSHLVIFTRSESSPNMRIARHPDGPTLYFHILGYTLSESIRKAHKKQRPISHDTPLAPPLLVLSGFSQKKKHDVLLRTVLQNMFPAISPDTTNIEDMKRVLLFKKVDAEKEEDEYIEMRHYYISLQDRGLSKAVRYFTGKGRSVRSLNGGKVSGVPNMAKMEDVSEFLLNAQGYVSDSEAESDVMSETGSQTTTDSRNKFTKQKAVKLYELGPRMRLDFYKAVDGHEDGNVVYHKYIHKTEAEVQAHLQKQKAKEAEKAKRRAEQEENLKRKEAEKESRKRQKPEQEFEGMDSDNEEEEDDNDDEEDHNPEDDILAA